MAWTPDRALAKMLAYLGEVERRGLHQTMSVLVDVPVFSSAASV